MATKAANDDFDGLNNITVKSINLISLLLVPASFGIIIFSKEIIHYLFGRGAFDKNALIITSVH